MKKLIRNSIIVVLALTLSLAGVVGVFAQSVDNDTKESAYVRFTRLLLVAEQLYYNDGDNVEIQSKYRLDEAYEAACELILKDNITDEEYNAMSDRLQTAIDGYTILKWNTDRLWSVIERCNAIDKSKYTAESVEAMNLVGNNAIVTFYYGQSQEEVDQAADDLEAAINNLVPISNSNPSGVLGDANEDSVLNIKDATTIQKYIAGIINLSEKGKELADYDENGEINIKDATAIQKCIAGIDF